MILHTEEDSVANKNFDRNIFGRKIQAPKKNVREPAPLTAVSAMNEISIICQSRLKSFFDEKNIKDGYRSILLVLGKEDGVSQPSISKQTCLKPSTVSIALKKMEKEGYVTRMNDPIDMRMSRVYLTETGLAITNEAYEIEGQLEAILMKEIGPNVLQTVINVTEKMKRNYTGSVTTMQKED